MYSVRCPNWGIERFILVRILKESQDFLQMNERKNAEIYGEDWTGPYFKHLIPFFSDHIPSFRKDSFEGLN